MIQPIKNTDLFKHILKHREALDMSEDGILAALLNASLTTAIRWDEVDISSALTWRETCQGSDFWREMSSIIELEEDDEDREDVDEDD